MKIKLRESIVGERIAYAPRQIVECSDADGNRLIERGSAVRASADAEIDGVLPGPTAQEVAAARAKQEARRPGSRETATAPRPQSGEAPASCQGTTTSGNPCGKKPVPGSEFCAKHGG